MCERNCDCKICKCSKVNCGECYVDSLEQCRNGGIHNCRGYVPNKFLKRIWYAIIGKIEWFQI